MGTDGNDQGSPSRRDFLKAGSIGALTTALAGCEGLQGDGEDGGSGNETGGDGAGGTTGPNATPQDGAGDDSRDEPFVATPAAVSGEFARDADRDLTRATFLDERYTRIEGEMPGVDVPEDVTPVGHAVTYGHDMQLPGDDGQPTLNQLSAGFLSLPNPDVEGVSATPYAEQSLSELVADSEENLLLAAAGLGPSVEWLNEPVTVEQTDVEAEFVDGTMTVETFVAPVAAEPGPGMPASEDGFLDDATAPRPQMMTLHIGRGFVGENVVVGGMIEGWGRPPSAGPPAAEIGDEYADLLADVYDDVVGAELFTRVLGEAGMLWGWLACNLDEMGPKPEWVEETVEYTDHYGITADGQVELGYPDETRTAPSGGDVFIRGRNAPGVFDCESFDPDVHDPGEKVFLTIEQRVTAYPLEDDGAVPFSVIASPRAEIAGEERNQLVDGALTPNSSLFDDLWNGIWELVEETAPFEPTDWDFQNDLTVVDDGLEIDMLGQSAEAKGFRGTISYADDDGSGTDEEDVYLYLARVVTADEVVVAGALSVDTGAGGFFDRKEGTRRLFAEAVEDVVAGPAVPNGWADGSIDDLDLVQICRNTRLETGSGDELHQPDPKLVEGRNTAAPFDASTFAETALSDRQLRYGVFQFDLANRSEAPFDTILSSSYLDELDQNLTDPDVLFDETATDDDPDNDLPVFELQGGDSALDLEFRAPSGYVHDVETVEEGLDYETTGFDVLRVGVTFVVDPDSGQNYGDGRGYPARYQESVEGIFEYLKRTYPTGLAVFRSNKGIVGAKKGFSNNAAKNEKIDYRDARASLERKAKPGNGNYSYDGETLTHKVSESDADSAIRSNGFDVWVLIVPDGYYAWHKGKPGLLGLASWSDRLAVTTKEAAGRNMGGPADCGETCAQEIGHQLVADPYEQPTRGIGEQNPLAQRDTDGSETDNRDFDHARHLDSTNSGTPNDGPGLVSRAYSLAEGEFVVPNEFRWADGGVDIRNISNFPVWQPAYGPNSDDSRLGRVESYMSYSDRGCWADSLITQDVLNGDLNRAAGNFRTVKLGGVTDLGTLISDEGSSDTDQEDPSVEAVEVYEDYVTEVDEWRLARADRIVEVSVFGREGEVVAEKQVPGALGVDGHDVDETRLDGIAFDVELPREAVDVVLTTDDADETLRLNPITRPIRDAYGRLPEEGRGPDFDREGLEGLLGDVDADMEQGNFARARDRLSTFADERLSGTVDPEFEPLANQPNEARLRSLFDRMIGRLGDLATPVSGERLECGAQLPGQITEDTVLQRDCTYTIAASTGPNVKEGATLHVEPGVEVVAEQGVGLTVDDGALSARGTEDDPIEFRGSESERGYWNGIEIRSDSPDTELSHVTVSDAGDGYWEAAIGVHRGDSTQATIRNCTVRNSSSGGVLADGGCELVDFRDNVIEDCGGSPLHLHPNLLGSLTGTTTFRNNDKSHVLVGIAGRTEAVTDDATWHALDLPYEFRNGVDVKSRVDVDPGATLRFQGGGPHGLFVSEGGRLRADASGGDPITFRGLDEAPGTWRGIYVRTEADNLLDNVVVRHGGGGYRGATVGVGVEGAGSLAIRNSTVAAGSGVGILVPSEGDLADFRNNTVENVAGVPIQLHPDELGALTGTTNFSGNDRSHVLVGISGRGSESVTDDATWPEMAVPYQGNNNVEIRSAVDVDPGATFRFPNDPFGLFVSGDGRLVADASEGDPITFRGVEQSPGSWRGVYVSSTAENLLDNVVVRHGGGGYRNANVGVGIDGEGASTVRNSVIADSAGWGIILDDGTLTTENNTFENNADGDVKRPDG